MAKVKIIIGPDGSIKTEAIDFKGERCMKATSFIEKLFGKSTSDKKKPEFYEKDNSDKDIDINGVPSGWCG